MSVIVEATLSVFLERLVDQLLSITPTLHQHEAEIAKEVQKWRPILADLRSVVEHAENKKSSISEINYWLKDLEDIASDVEDVLEELEYDNNHSQKRAKVSKFVSSVLKSLTTPKAVIELQKLTEQLNQIVARKQLVESLLKGNAIIPWQQTIRDPSGSMSAERKLYGREAEKDKIINFLRHEKDEMDVLPIVGVGGIGKTTLLQHIYNSDEVVHSFQVRAWVCVSREWNLRNIFKSIIEAATGKQSCDLQDLSCKVHDELKRKKFCIVLDDLWSLSISQWNELRAPLLRAGAPGSKVLVTTRNLNVANCVKTVDTHIDLSCLSQDDWLELYCSYVGFDVRKSSNYKLRKAGEDISKRCGGLPLAATILGSRLHENYDENDWSALLNNKSIMSRDGQYQIELVLKMSYDDLPYILRHCFLYCTIFPEDHQFREHDLVQLWIAAGLIKSSNDGHCYFVELVSRSLLMSFGDYYVMHDLIRDMGRNVSDNTYSRWETTLESSWKKVKHLSIHKSMMNQVITDLRRQREEITFSLRTLMLIGGEYDINQVDCNLLFSKFPKLRVFQGRALPIQNVSKFIGCMKYLKYLDLSGCTRLTRLPVEIGNLCNLVGLDLQECTGLTCLPVEVGKLYKLEWMDLAGCIGLMQLPREISNLSCLTRLYLKGCIWLTWLPAEVGKLCNLEELDLQNCIRLTLLPVEVGKLGNLTRLDLQECMGLKVLPIEVGNLGNLQELNLQGCIGLTALPIEVRNLGNLQKRD